MPSAIKELYDLMIQQRSLDEQTEIFPDAYTPASNQGIQELYEYMYGPPGTQPKDYPHAYEDVPSEGIRLHGRTLEMPPMLEASEAVIVMQLIEAIENDELTPLRVILQYYRDCVMKTLDYVEAVTYQEIMQALEDRGMRGGLEWEDFIDYNPPYTMELFIEDDDEDPPEWVIHWRVYEIIVQFIDLW
jgi:hypothetical protein